MSLGTKYVKENCGQTYGRSRWNLRAIVKAVAKKARRYNDKKIAFKAKKGEEI